MTARAILEELQAQGIDLECTPDGKTLTAPADTLTDRQRTMVRKHKTELIRLVLESERITKQLLQAAKRACDHWGDSPAAREQMRLDCLNTPPHLRADLLAQFRKQYGSDKL